MTTISMVRPEIRLANDQLVSWISPARGGQLYGLDLRAARHNLLSTIQRKPEAYHEKVKQGESEADGEAASIHDRVVFKQEGLDQNSITTVTVGSAWWITSMTMIPSCFRS